MVHLIARVRQVGGQCKMRLVKAMYDTEDQCGRQEASQVFLKTWHSTVSSTNYKQITQKLFSDSYCHYYLQLLFYWPTRLELLLVYNHQNLVWLSGNALVSINVVTLYQARLVPGWMTVSGWVNRLGTEPGIQVYSAWAISLRVGATEYPAKAGEVNRHIVW